MIHKFYFAFFLSWNCLAIKSVKDYENNAEDSELFAVRRSSNARNYIHTDHEYFQFSWWCSRTAASPLRSGLQRLDQKFQVSRNLCDMRLQKWSVQRNIYALDRIAHLKLFALLKNPLAVNVVQKAASTLYHTHVKWSSQKNRHLRGELGINFL